MSYDGAASVFALGARFSRLDAAGKPLTGAGNGYKTDALVQAKLGLQYQDGTTITQVVGSGAQCVNFKSDDTVQWGTADMQFCAPDPNVLGWVIGGDTITNGAGVAEVQTVTLNGVPTGGTFTLSLDGIPTAPIAYNAAAAAVQTAVTALANVGVGNATVTGSVGGPYTVTFASSLGNVHQLVGNGAALTGGTAPTVTTTTTTAGSKLTDFGYRAPRVGTAPTPNGISVEFWTEAIIGDVVDSVYPYIRWVLPRGKFKLSEAFTLDSTTAATPQFTGILHENTNWGSGPLQDWTLAPSERVWQYARVATIPDLTPGTFTVL